MYDLIDREALLKRLHDAGGCGAPAESWADGYDKAIDLAYGMAENAPAIDAAPVVRGEWVGYETSSYNGNDEYGEPRWIPKKFFRCSICRKGTAVRHNFCPNCGAKMDGGNDND